MRKNVTSGSPFEPEIGFSRACRIDNLIAVSGTAPIDENGGVASPGDVYDQTLRCLEISKVAIEEAGGSIQNVIRTRIMLVDIEQWKDAARAHGEFFRDVRPACTFVEISRFINPDWLVETEVDCLIEADAD